MQLDAVFDAIPPDVTDLCRRLREHGKRGWVVGGCVRDLLRGAAAKDWDVATDARPEEVQRIFRRVIPTGIAHGTVTVLMHGRHYEVTTLRGEGAYADGRRPDEVFFLDDIEQDLARRDFTMNAIALDPTERALIDPFDGRGDLERRILRAVGDPLARFTEDGLRVLRAARFAATLECEVEEVTLRAMADPRALDILRRVSAERIHDEWVKAMTARTPSIAFRLMQRSGILAVCAPELVALVGRGDAFDRALAVVDVLPADAALRVAGLVQDMAQPADAAEKAADALLRRLKFSNEDRQRVVDLVRGHVIDYAPSWSDADVRRWMRRITRERLDDQLALARVNAQVAGEAERAAVEELEGRVRRILGDGAVLTARELSVGGKELMRELSLPPGPRIGEILAALVEVVTEDPAANEPHRLIDEARRLCAPSGEERP